MSNVLDQIKEAGYIATEAEIEQLAALHTDVSNTQGVADGSYLKILLAGCQASLGKGRKKYPKLKETQVEVLDKIHGQYYLAVLRGVMTDEIAITEGLEEDEIRRRRVEQLRRATFARSAKSTLNAYVEADGDLRTLDVATTSKNILRKFVNEAAGTPSWMQTVESNRNKIEKICRNLAQTNPGQAREILESVLQHIQDVLDSISGGDRTGQESVVVFTADVPTIVEVPENVGEQATALGSVDESTEPFFVPHIPEMHEFSEVANSN